MLTITIKDSEYYPESPKVIEVRDLADISQSIEAFRMAILFQLNPDNEAEMNRFAEQHFLNGLSLLEQAQRTFRIAWMEELSKR